MKRPRTPPKIMPFNWSLWDSICQYLFPILIFPFFSLGVLILETLLFTADKNNVKEILFHFLQHITYCIVYTLYYDILLYILLNFSKLKKNIYIFFFIHFIVLYFNDPNSCSTTYLIPWLFQIFYVKVSFLFDTYQLSPPTALHVHVKFSSRCDQWCPAAMAWTVHSRRPGVDGMAPNSDDVFLRHFRDASRHGGQAHQGIAILSCPIPF